MMTDREEIRRWLQATLIHMGWSGSDLAKRISVVPSTINRFLNDPDVKHSLSPKTLKAIEKATGIPALSYPSQIRGFAPVEAEAHFLSDNSSSQDPVTDEALRNLRRAQSNLQFWQLRSQALEAVGFLSGDVLAVDISERPRNRDIVCAEVDLFQPGRIDTVFRIFEAPYLIAATGALELMKPLVVDDAHVVIKGVVVNMLRPMRSRAA
jgi:transcriptional regulator with XRE-family HTH domain